MQSEEEAALPPLPSFKARLYDLSRCNPGDCVQNKTPTSSGAHHWRQRFFASSHCLHVLPGLSCVSPTSFIIFRITLKCNNYFPVPTSPLEGIHVPHTSCLSVYSFQHQVCPWGRLCFIRFPLPIRPIVPRSISSIHRWRWVHPRSSASRETPEE